MSAYQNSEPMYILNDSHKRMAKVCARECTRYAINGIRFEPSGVAVATDGRRLLAIRTEAYDGAHELLLPREAAAKIDKGGAELGNGQPGVVTVASANCQRTYASPNSSFPDWRSILPVPDETYRHISVDRKMLSELLASMPDGPESDGEKVVTLTIPARPVMPVIVWNSRAFGLLMPVGRFTADPGFGEPADSPKLADCQSRISEECAKVRNSLAKKIEVAS